MKSKRLMQTIILIIIIVLGLFYYISKQNKYTFFEVSEAPLPITNPLKGYLANAKEDELLLDTELKFILVYWSDIEKSEGIYDFESLEADNNFDYWKALEKRFIIRIVADYPNAENAMQIPNWLYEKINGDGQWYDNSYGKGFSPNYANEEFIACHQALIKAFGERYDNDPYVVGFQLGSVGHWGEWHINHDEDLQDLPKSEVTDKYVKAYLAAFKHTDVFMRRPYTIAKEHDIGLFNDSFGNAQATEEFKQWLDKGYISEQNNEKMPAMPDIWKKAIMGGELSSIHSFEEYYSTLFGDMYMQLLAAHITYLGPNAPIWYSEDNVLMENIMALNQAMGYCFRVNKVGIIEEQELKYKIQIDNIGIAPMLKNWPIRLVLKDLNNNVLDEQILDGELDQWHNVSWELVGSFKNINQDILDVGYIMEIAILSDTTNQPAVKLANGNEVDNNVYRILYYKK